MAVHLVDHDRPLADRGRHALDRPGADVPDREDARQRRLEICSAGHPPAMLFAGAEVTETVSTGRPLLGVGQGQAESAVLDLAAGTTLLVYTDGLVERRDAALQTAVDRLSALGPRVAALGVDEFADLVVETSGSGEDDMTVLVVRLS